MKKVIKLICASLMVALVLSLSIVPAFAAGDKLVLNGESAKLNKGDVITYELNLGDCEEVIHGLQAYIIYDQEYLEVVSDSLAFPNLTGVVSNTDLDNYLTFNWTDISNPGDFAKSKCLATVDFKVLKGGETDITYFVNELYGEDMTYLKQYTFTYNVKVNDKIVIENAVPAVNNDDSFKNQFQGGFTNYADGKGEKNGSGDNHVAVTGVTTALGTDAVTEVLQDSNNTGTILTVVAIVVVIIAIIIVVILRNSYNRKKQDET